MERVTSIDQLKAGDKIARVWNGEIKIIEFLCRHPHNKEYSLFLNSTYDGMPKFYNKRLVEEKWYLFTGTNEDWDEVYTMRIEDMQDSLNRWKEYREIQRKKHKQELS